MASQKSESTKRIETSRILNIAKYYLKNIIKDYIRSQEDFEVTTLYDSNLKNNFINDCIESATNESLFLYNDDDKFNLYIKMDTLYDGILKNTIIEYKNELTAEYNKQKKEFLNTPQGQKWQQKQEVKKAWQEVKENWQPIKKQLKNGVKNTGIFAGVFMYELARASKPKRRRF